MCVCVCVCACVGPPPVTSIVMASELAPSVMTFSAVFIKLTAGNILRTPNRTVLSLARKHTHTQAHLQTICKSLSINSDCSVLLVSMVMEFLKTRLCSERPTSSGASLASISFIDCTGDSTVYACVSFIDCMG